MIVFSQVCLASNVKEMRYIYLAVYIRHLYWVLSQRVPLNGEHLAPDRFQKDVGTSVRLPR